jgi:bifunctional DNA-binding transcriptional regulator/antitoxin component of YhaV-PrlF toxin-antitoxin module
MRINARGQVTIPVEIRKQARLLPHTKVVVEFDGEHVRIVRARKRSKHGKGKHLIALLRGTGDVAMSTEAIMVLPVVNRVFTLAGNNTLPPSPTAAMI